jgi:uncharacterized protein YbjT (DUF2867 family)
MKIILTGSLGHIGKPLTKDLVGKGHAVTVISSNREKQKDIEALGARAAIGSMQDLPFLKTAFAGADLVYTMVPPFNFFDPRIDMLAYYRDIVNNYVQAIEDSGVKRVVHLSSVGAHMSKGSGLILSHHEGETILNKLGQTAITFMRPVAFYYNLLAFIDLIKKAGMIVSNYGAGDRVPWVSPKDIADAIAEEIDLPPVDRKIRYVASEELTCSEVAGILGRAIGKPDLQWAVTSNEEMLKSLASVGMPAAIAEGFVEMNAGLHSGELSADYFRNRPAVLGKVKMTDFAREFAAAFKQNG